MCYHGRCWTHALSMPGASNETLRTAAFASCITMHHHAVGPSLTVCTIATMPARTGSGSSDQASTTTAKSGSTGVSAAHLVTYLVRAGLPGFVSACRVQGCESPEVGSSPTRGDSSCTALLAHPAGLLRAPSR